jgi:hypothetical protein
MALDRRRRLSLALATVTVVALAGCGGGGGAGPTPSPDPNPPLGGEVPLGRAITLASGVALAAGPEVAFSSNGTATVAWGQSGLPIPGSTLTRTVPDVGARESSSGDTFAAAELINGSTTAQDQAGDTLADLWLGAGRDGRGAQAAWRRDRAASLATDALATARREGVGWSSAAIPTAAPPAALGSLRVASNGLGTDAAVWVETSGSLSQVRLSVRSAGTSWGPAQAVQATSLVVGSEPDVAVDPDGNVMVVWRQGADGAGIVWARRFPSDGSTAAAVPIDGPIPPDSRLPRVVATAANRFVAVWLRVEGDGVTRSLRAREAQADQWLGTTARPLELQNDTVDEVQLAPLPNAGAIAVWRQADGLQWTRLTNGAWLSNALEVTSDASAVRSPRLATDADGRTYLAWLRRSGGVDDLRVSTLAPLGDTFSTPVSARVGTGSASDPALAVMPTAPGSVVLAWRQAVAGQAEPDLLVRLWRR